MRRWWLAWALAAACGGAQTDAEGPSPPPIPTGFTPAPRLGPEPPGTGLAQGSEWLDAVHAELHPRWADNFLEQSRVYLPPDHALNNPSLETTIKFGVAPDGQVRNVEIARPSGTPDFDAAAREMIVEASPLPAPPPGLASDDGDVHVSWLFARDVRQDSVAGAAIEKLQWEPERAVPALLATGRVGEAAARVAAVYEKGGDTPAASRHALARQVAGGALVAALEDDRDPSARVDAARAVAAAGYAPAAPALRKLAADGNDIGVQTAALRALGELRDADAEPVLSEALARVDGERGAAAAAALVRLGKAEHVWATLGPRAAGSDERLRASAIADLADAGIPESQGLLVATLGDRARPRAERVAAAQGLGPLARDAGGPAAKALIAALADGDAAVRAAAASGLARAADGGLRGRAPFFAVAPLLKDRDPRVQAAAVRAAAKLDPRAALPEIGLVGARAKDPAVLAATVEAVGEIPGPEAVQQLRRWSGSKNPDVRLAAHAALARRSEPEARAIVARAPAGDDPRLAALVVAASEDRGVLEKALGSPAPDARAAAVKPLARVAGVDVAIPAALRALADAHGARERVLLGRELLAVIPK